MADEIEIVLLPAETFTQPTPPMERDESVALEVRRLAELGIPKSSIYRFLRLPVVRFEKLYGQDFFEGQMGAGRRIAALAMEAAEAGNVPMIMFLCKTRLGWNETSVVEHIGEVRSVVSSQPMSKEEFMRRYLEKGETEE
jgi:hypothetical protein